MASVEKYNRVLTIGLDTEGLNLMTSELANVSMYHVDTDDKFEALLEDESEENFIPLIFCGPKLNQFSPYEVAQTIRNTYPQSRIIFILGTTEDLKISTLKKNGASEVFILPNDKSLLNMEFDDVVKLIGSAPGLTRYRAVQLFDIEPEDELPFDLSVFLPMNNKYIKVVKSGDKVRRQQIDKFKEKQVGRVFIDSRQTDQFYDYCAEKLADLNDPNSAMSETERKQKLQTSVRDLFATIHDGSDNADFEVGRQVMKQSESVVAKFLEKKTGISFHKQIEAALGSTEDSYTHASSVSAIASLLSMATEIGKPEDLALAGLFHDVALLGFKHDPYPGDEFVESLEADERKKYLDHPMDAQRVLKTKKMTITPEIVKIIEQHHERNDGKGFPQALSAAKIIPEAQLLSIADQIEYYGQFRPGEQRLSPLQAIDAIEKNGSISLEVLFKVRKVLKSESNISTRD